MEIVYEKIAGGIGVAFQWTGTLQLKAVLGKKPVAAQVIFTGKGMVCCLETRSCHISAARGSVYQRISFGGTFLII